MKSPLSVRALSVMALALILSTLFACESKKEQIPPVKVIASMPEQKNVQTWIEATGTSQPVTQVNIVARVEGTLQKVNFKAGGLVQKGDILFEIDPSSFEVQLEQATALLGIQQAALRRAEIEYRRNLELYKEKAAAQTNVVQWKEQLASTQSQVRQAQAQVNQARIQLGYTTLRAPFTGKISSNTFDEGSIVSPQSGALAQLVSQDPVYALFAVNAEEILPILKPSGSTFAQSGNLSNSTMPSIPLELAIGRGAFSHKGVLDYIAPEVDAQSGALNLRGSFPNPDGSLLPGLFVRIRIPSRELRNALLIPQSAIGEAQSGAYVMIIDADKKAQIRPVQLGPLQRDPLKGDMQVITQGLELGIPVITEGLARVRPGQEVQAEIR